MWGVALANLVHGVPLNSKGDFTGNVLDLFSAYTVLAGISVVALFAFHGAIYLTLRTSGELLRARGRGGATAVGAGDGPRHRLPRLDGRRRRRPQQTATPSRPCCPRRSARSRSWPPSRSCARAAAAGPSPPPRWPRSAWVATIFTGLYPRVLVSHPDFANSLTISGAAAGHYALQRHHGRGGDLLADRAALPGLDLPRVPRPARRRGRRRVRPSRSTAAPPACRGLNRPCAPWTRACSAAPGPSRPLLALDTALGVATTAFVLLQATLLARIVAGAFAGAPRERAATRRGRAGARLRGPRRARLGHGGRGPPRGVERALRAAPRARRAPAATRSRPRPTGRSPARSRRPPCRASRRSRRTSPATCRRSCSPRSSRFAVVGVGRDRRPRVGARAAADAAARAGVHVADRPRHRAAHARALARAAQPVDALPRRRARAAHAAGVQPRPRAGDTHRRGQRALPPRDDGDAARQLPLGLRARAGGDARRRARRGDGRRAPGRRRPRAAGRTDRARARARGLPAAAPARRGVPRERRRPGGRRPDARAARRARRDRAGGPRPAPSPAVAPVRLERVAFAYPARAGLVLDGLDLELRAGRDRGARGRERRRQEHGRGAAARLAGADGRARHGRRRRPRGLPGAGLARARGLGAAAPGAGARQRRGQHPARRAGRV